MLVTSYISEFGRNFFAGSSRWSRQHRLEALIGGFQEESNNFIYNQNNLLATLGTYLRYHNLILGHLSQFLYKWPFNFQFTMALRASVNQLYGRAFWLFNAWVLKGRLLLSFYQKGIQYMVTIRKVTQKFPVWFPQILRGIWVFLVPFCWSPIPITPFYRFIRLPLLVFFPTSLVPLSYTKLFDP